ncbi:MAG: glycoside hydrolase, partial [Anaerolineae bacterium]|nr:glycoside hydrolase [Anaerolineae bacterium]
MTNSLPVGFYPFWFWNATLSAEEIRRQIAEMAEKGVRGFFIHSRQGLGQPYLSESFFKMVDAAIGAAEEHDMVVHLYDEYPYPSGIAGGEVVLGNPQFHATQLIQRSYDLAGGPVRLELPRGKILSCIAFPATGGAPDWDHGIDLRSHVGVVLAHDSYNEMGLTQYNRKRYFASEPTPTLETELPEGSYRLLVSVQAEVTHHKYWNHFVDPLNAEAIRHFIELTHERYFARFGDRFGTTIRSIYV